MLSNHPKSPIERSFDRIITSNNRNESFFSPLKYNPKYQDDTLARAKLKGTQSPNTNKETVNNYMDHSIIYNPKLIAPINNSLDNKYDKTNPIYFNFQQNPTNQAHQYRTNDYQIKQYVTDKLEPMIDRIKENISMKNNLNQQYPRQPSPRPHEAIQNLPKTSYGNSYNDQHSVHARNAENNSNSPYNAGNVNIL